MIDIIKSIFDFNNKNEVVVSDIRFDYEPGCCWVMITLARRDKKISKKFYFVPVGDGSFENFKYYNPDFELIMHCAAKELLEVIEK